MNATVFNKAKSLLYTLNTDSYCVHTVKVKMEVNTSLNKTTNKFDVRIKATRRE